VSGVRPPFVPDWIPDRVLLANTIAFEVLVVVAIWWFVVRRAERKKRALAIFAAIVTVVGLVETLGGIEILGARTLRMHVYGRFSATSGHLDTFEMQWEESRLLRRCSDRRVSFIYTDPSLGKFMNGVRRPLPPAMFEAIWPRVMEDSVWWANGPEPEFKKEIGLSLWKALCASPLAKNDAGIAAIVSRDGE
jgi:hypothetical protein